MKAQYQQNVNALKFLRKRSVGDMPMTVEAREAFLRQIEEAPGSEYLFPSPKSTGSKPYITNVRKGWAATLKKAGVPYFALYELRHTFATRLSAGGVADYMVPQMLRQGDAVEPPAE